MPNWEQAIIVGILGISGDAMVAHRARMERAFWGELGRYTHKPRIGRMSALGANRTCRDAGSDVNDPGCVKTHLVI
jgi:hypothetical protein